MLRLAQHVNSKLQGGTKRDLAWGAYNSNNEIETSATKHLLFYGYLKNATSFPFWIHNCPYLCAWAVCEYFSKNQEMVIWGKMAFFLQMVERKYAKSFANALRPFWNWGIFTNIIKMCHQGGYLRKPITWNPSSIKYAKIVVGLALEERHMKRSPYIIPCTFNHVLLWKYLEDHF